MPPFSADDTAFLINAARKGDASALEILFHRFLPRVNRIASIRMGCRLKEFADHEDIVQESMIEAFLRLPTMDLRHDGAFLNWLATIVENNIRDHRRHLSAQKRGAGLVHPLTDQGSTFLVDALHASNQQSPSPDYS